MPQCKAEFLVEPFREGEQGEHVVAGIAAVQSAGFTPSVGPFGTSIEGEPAAVSAAIDAMVTAALAKGASRISVSLTVLA